MRWIGTLTLAGLAACGASSDDEAARTPAEATAHRAIVTASRGALPRRVPRSHADAPRAAECGEFGFVPDTSREPSDPPPPGTWVRGRVADAADAPIPRARVAVFLGVSSVQDDTDEDGNFAIDIAYPTGVARCVAWAEDRAVAVGPWLALREGETIDAGTIRLEPGVRIEGRIAAADGSNAYGTVSVDWTDAYDTETWALVRRCAELDRVDVPYLCGGGGGFSIPCLRRGRYRLTVGDGGGSLLVDAPAADVVLAAAPPRAPESESDTASSADTARPDRGDTPVASPPTGSRTFRVVLPANFDRADDYDARVVGPDETVDDPEAELVRDELRVSQLRENVAYSLALRVRCGDAWTATTRVAAFVAGDDPVEIRIDPGLRISGCVVRDDGTPVVGAYVHAELGGNDCASAYGGLDGTFTLTGLEPGSWAIETSAPGLVPDQAKVTAAAGERGVRIVLRPDR